MKGIMPWKKKKNTAPAVMEDNWFDRFLDNPFENFLTPFSGNYSRNMPSVDVSENKNEVKVRAEVPGMKEDDIELSWDNGVLHLKGEKHEEKEDTKKGNYHRECSYGFFSRDIPLGKNVDWENADAKYKHGVLTIKFPKTESSKKSIDIKVK